MSLPLIRFASKPLTRRAKGPSLLCTPSPPPAHHQLHSKVSLSILLPFTWHLDHCPGVFWCISLLVCSLCVYLSLAPRVERLDESCEISWESLPHMKGDPIIYCLQCMQGNSDFKQVPMLMKKNGFISKSGTWFMILQKCYWDLLLSVYGQNRRAGSKQQVFVLLYMKND